MKQWVLLAEVEWQERPIAYDVTHVVPWLMAEHCFCYLCWARDGATRLLSMHMDFEHSWVHGSNMVQIEVDDANGS